MLERSEALQTRARTIDLNTHYECCSRSCERVRDVMLTRNLRFVHLGMRGYVAPSNSTTSPCTIHEGGILGAAGIDHAVEKPFGSAI